MSGYPYDKSRRSGIVPITKSALCLRPFWLKALISAVQFARQGQAVIVWCGLLAHRILHWQVGDSRKKIQSLGATKAPPFRRTPCPGPVCPSSVPEWTEIGLRDLIPLALAQLGHSEFDLGLGSNSGSGKVAFSLRGSCPSPEEPPKVGGFLTARLPGSQAGQRG